MSFGDFPVRANEPAVREFYISLNGAGAAVPTVQSLTGSSMTVARTGAGALTVTFSDNPGNFIGFGFAFGATTATDVDRWTAVRGPYSATTRLIAVTLFNESGTATDLAANTSVDLVFRFKATGV